MDEFTHEINGIIKAEITGEITISITDENEPQQSMDIDIDYERWRKLGLKPNDRVHCIVYEDGNFILEKLKE